MRVCAVICEYNPFHLGHAYHLRAAREASGADYVLCLMSGALTQRGAFARHDKWLRARAALENGADLVLELPTRFACAPAPDFASGGVASGPMTATFLLPFALGACDALGGNVVTDAFGVVAMVAMTPLVTIQLLGVSYQRKLSKRTPVPAVGQVEEIIELA